MNEAARYDVIGDFYLEFVARGLASEETLFYQLTAHLLELLPPLAGLDVLDLACGEGHLSRQLAAAGARVTGVDLAAMSGTPVHATGPGVVITAAYNGGYGNEVEIDHGNGVTTIYGHMSSIGVHVGDTVDTGTVIGRVGSTGRSTGPHLHYEIRRDDTPIDPMPHLNTGAQIAGLL